MDLWHMIKNLLLAHIESTTEKQIIDLQIQLRTLD